MHHVVRLTLFACAISAIAQEAPKPQFTARELFYSAASDQAPAAKEAPKTAPAPAPSKNNVAPKRPAQPAAVAPAPAPSPEPVAPQHAAPLMDAPATTMGATVVKASMTTAPARPAGAPLGIKYTILKQSADDTMVEVPQNTIFHYGDRIQVSVQTNGPGYLYVVLQGSSGQWQPMFPNADDGGGDNRVDGWNARVLPSNLRMAFDDQTGTERIFIVFSRTPEQSLENMIYSLKDGAAPAATPAADRQPKAQPKTLVQVAEANIDDGTVGRLRDTYTRDLIIETVDNKTPADKSSGEKKENAVYVVNPTGSSDSRVVADVKLVHQ